jgi:hypothetical protein
MHTFKDNEGRPWTVAINIATAKRVKAVTGINLYDAVGNGLKSLADLLRDPLTLVDVIYLCCEEQAEAKHVTDVDFGRALAGDVIESAIDAFLQALIDFFPDARTRATLTTLIKKARTLQDRMFAQAQTAVENLDIDSALLNLKSVSGSSPALSESIPAG